jgi:hypothetical protein
VGGICELFIRVNYWGRRGEKEACITHQVEEMKTAFMLDSLIAKHIVGDLCRYMCVSKRTGFCINKCEVVKLV